MWPQDWVQIPSRSETPNTQKLFYSEPDDFLKVEYKDLVV